MEGDRLVVGLGEEGKKPLQVGRSCRVRIQQAERGRGARDAVRGHRGSAVDCTHAAAPQLPALNNLLGCLDYATREALVASSREPPPPHLAAKDEALHFLLIQRRRGVMHGDGKESSEAPLLARGWKVGEGGVTQRLVQEATWRRMGPDAHSPAFVLQLQGCMGRLGYHTPPPTHPTSPSVRHKLFKMSFTF